MSEERGDFAGRRRPRGGKRNLSIQKMIPLKGQPPFLRNQDCFFSSSFHSPSQFAGCRLVQELSGGTRRSADRAYWSIKTAAQTWETLLPQPVVKVVAALPTRAVEAVLVALAVELQAQAALTAVSICQYHHYHCHSAVVAA